MSYDNKAPTAPTAGANANSTNSDESTERNTSIPCTSAYCKRILQFIPKGHDNAIPRRDLAALIGLHERDCRRAIERARVAGEFILSDDAGYWMADPHTEEGVGEIMRWYRREGGRIRALAKRLEPVRRRVEAARAVGADQISVEGWANE
ncbi:MAG: hypothetical protein FWC27_01525 [Firmicutes bacterium]|nr:hypothetical protein [Bacillota bacterium]